MKYNYKELHSAIVAWMENENRILPAWVEDVDQLHLQDCHKGDLPIYSVRYNDTQVFYIVKDFTYYTTGDFTHALNWIGFLVFGDLERFKRITNHKQAIELAIKANGGEFRGTDFKAYIDDDYGVLTVEFPNGVTVIQGDSDHDYKAAYYLFNMDNSIFAIEGNNP